MSTVSQFGRFVDRNRWVAQEHVPRSHVKSIMKITRFASLLLLMFLAASRCLGLVLIETVSKERAEKDFGASIRTEAVGTNQVGVWLEFTPKGKLRTLSSVQLEITSGDHKLVSATLAPSKQTPENVVVYFSTDPAYLPGSRLTVFYRISSGYPPYDGIQFNVADFIKHEASH